MDDLIGFLRARLAEEEAAARQATEGPWVAEVSGETGHCVILADAQSTREYVARTQLYAATFDAEHIARRGPVRVLAEVEAKREVIRLTEAAQDFAPTFTTGVAAVLENALRLFTQAYTAHPDYRPEWAPTA